MRTSATQVEKKISFRQARGLLSITDRGLSVLIAEGHLSVFDVPGSRPKLLRSEVVALAQKSIRRARAAAEVRP